MKIIITKDTSCEMLRIEKENGECLFEGNETDFDRSAESFERLFKKVGLETQIIEKDYDEWHKYGGDN